MRDEEIRSVQERLAEVGNLRRVGAGEFALFDLYDLAATAEGEFGTVLDAEAPNSGEEVAELKRRLRWLDPEGHAPFACQRQCYWIVDPVSEERVGTVAVSDWLSGRDCVKVSSLYVRPGRRGSGFATGALESVYGAALACGLRGLRLDTEWTWASAVDFSLRRGCWLFSWKHCLMFSRASYLPPYALREAAGGGLVFAVLLSGEWTDLITASVADERLVLTEHEAYARLDAEGHVIAWHTAPTLSIQLAVRGLPLVRGPEQEALAAEGRWCDSGWPEGLAEKIEVFETIARESGRRVPARRRPRDFHFQA
jgi:GNAT superfamily N-acetyltransferase